MGYETVFNVSIGRLENDINDLTEYVETVAT